MTAPAQRSKKLDRQRKRMRQMVAKYQEYVASYDQQSYYADYSDKTFLDDMLYGIGLSMQIDTATDYTGAGGYERFKQTLREHLK